MKPRILINNNRNKAFLGAIIGTAANVIGGAISAKKQKKAQEAAFRQQQLEQNRTDGLKQAAAMSSAYNNQDYVEEYNKKITFKNGGKMKSNNYNDRISIAKKYKCGGRKKSSLGSFLTSQFTGEKADSNITNMVGGLGNLVSSITSNPSAPKQVQTSDGFSFSNKSSITKPDYQMNGNNNSVNNNPNNNPNNNTYNDRINMYKCGGRKKAKCGGSRKK